MGDPSPSVGRHGAHGEERTTWDGADAPYGGTRPQPLRPRHLLTTGNRDSPMGAAHPSVILLIYF